MKIGIVNDLPLVAIGASAGGPGALATILGGLPESFPAAIVIVQHVDEQFALGMAQWLAQNSKLPVDIVRPGDRPAAGTALLACTNDHLVFSAPNRLDYTPKPVEAIHRPSIDVFFHSVLRFWPGPVVGVLLTGMGRDGAAGLKALREYGHFTIAQDKATSSVFGMPKAAAALGAASEILSLDEIASTLARRFARPS